MNSSRVFRSLASCAVLALTLVLAPGAFADSQARIVRLSYTLGAVQIDRGQGWEKAIMNMPIIQGTQLETGADSRAEVEFEDGATLRLGPDTRVDFSQLALRDSGARISALEIPSGTAYFNFRRRGHDQFRFNFGGQALDLTHNVHFRAEMNRSQLALAVFKGELQWQAPAKTVKIKKHETLTLNLGDQAGYQLAKGISLAYLDNWDSDRAQYQNQYAFTGSYNSLPYYGSSDLSYYGTWIDSPLYGTLWRPYYVGYNWDPFWNGAWSWYPSYGYTWISGYPWGWTPYRYGSWLFVPNYGWAWRPGSTWTSWNAAPVIVNPPPTYHLPVAPLGPTLAPTNRPRPTVLVNNTPPNALAPMRPAPIFRDFDSPMGRRTSGVMPNSGTPAAGPSAMRPVTSPGPGMIRPSGIAVTDRGYLTPQSPRAYGMGGFHSMHGAGVYGRGNYGGGNYGSARGSGPSGSSGPRSMGSSHMGGMGGGHSGASRGGGGRPSR